MIHKQIILLAVVLLALLVAGCSGTSVATPTPLPAKTAAPVATKPAAVPIVTQPAAQPQPAKGPRIAFDTDRVDFGNIKFNVPVAYTFAFRNAGDAPLVIQGEPPVKAVEGC